MEDRYLQGRASLLSVSIEGDLYELNNGHQILIYSSEGKCEYGYYYFDENKKLIDGGEFDFDAGSSKEVLEEAMLWCGLNTETYTYNLIEQEVDTQYLEDEGYTGF